ERKLSIGGGMWGGGMMFNEIVVQEEGARILREVGVEVRPWKEGYYIADAVECVCGLGWAACKAGARIFNLMSVEDVLVREGRVTGLVLNWTAVEMAGLHVDPLALRSRYVVEATGHELSVLHVLQRKMEVKLATPSGKIEGERSMWAEVAEAATLENTREVYPGIFVTGMAANATFGSFRMGPIFGGMLLSGEKVAREITRRLREEK
ncbi:MAG: ribose 1,5-bisphosphate isomerase, partial [Thermodesulfatator sp.]